MYKKFREGFFWSAIGQYGRIISSLIINMFLSRLLSPKEYGQVAMVMIFITFFQLMTEAGLGPAIIQQKGFEERDHSNLFIISVFFSVGFSILFGLFGFAIAAYYQDNNYIKFSWLLSIVVLFSGLQIVPNAIMLKKQQFKEVNLINLFVTIVTGMISIFLATKGFGVYTLIINSIINSFVTFLLLIKITKIQGINSLDFEPLKKVWNFSKNQFGFNFINYFSRNADSLLIGKFMSSSALGNYNKSYQLLMYPTTIFGGVVSPVLQPVLSNYQNDSKMIRNVYFKLVYILAILTIPFSVFLAFSAKPIILIMYGNQWQEAIQPFKILSLTVWIQVISSTAGAIFQSRNKTKDLFITGILSAVVLVTAIILGVLMGSIQTVAGCLSIAFLWNFIQSYWFLTHKALDSDMFTFLKIFIKPMLFGTIVFIIFTVYNCFFSYFFENIFVDLIIRMVVFIVTFVVILIIFHEQGTLLSLLKPNSIKNGK